VPPDLALVDEVVAIISGAERPVVVRGRSAIWSGARSTLGALAEESGALMATIQIRGGCEFA
jgi:thiamine pyrophosphate-dependent acetolactate synthase large subunit-like protein